MADADAPAPAKESRFKRRDPSAAPPRPSPLGAGPDADPARSSGIKVIPVEQRPADAFQGVAKVDPDENAGSRVAKLVAGDVAAILVFAAVGRGNHGEGMFIGDVFATALPFLIGWFAVSPVAGTFGEDARVRPRVEAAKSRSRSSRRREARRSEALVPTPPFRLSPSRRSRILHPSLPLTFALAQGTKVGPAAAAAAKGWATGIPLGLVIRGVGKGQIPPKPFVVVAMAATGAFLVGWRAWFAKGGSKKGGNKQGNPLEFMNLLMSLTKRW